MNSKIITSLVEPFIKLKILDNKKNKVIYNQTLRQKEKYSFYQKAFDFLYSNNISGAYFEFGCHKARTIRFALRESIIKNIDMDFYAFDSFKGLPNHKNNTNQNAWYLEGRLKTEISKFKKLIKPFEKYKKIFIIKGFYKNSLTPKLKQKFKKKKIKTSFINIDCDLEISVKESLNFALNYITNGTILYVDDYYTTHKGDTRKGIPKIVSQLLKRHKIHYEPWHLIGAAGKSFLLYK